MNTKQIIGTWRFTRCLREDGTEFPVQSSSSFTFNADGSGTQDYTNNEPIQLTWKFSGDRLQVEVFGEGKRHRKDVLDMPSPEVLVHVDGASWRPIHTRWFYERITKPNA
jgi:hypothetical protein